MHAWPPIESFQQHVPLPEGVCLRFFRPEELDTLPSTWVRWYPAVRVGAESVFLQPDWLRANIVTTESLDRPIYAYAIEKDGVPVAMMSFQREPHAGTLHGRLGVLDPDARVGILGALGFPAFVKLGELVGAELLLVWVTLATRTQQFMARRNGFRLCGIVPGFDRDAHGEGSRRVFEALYARLLVDDDEVVLPADDALLPETRALLEQILSGPKQSRR